MDLAVQYRPREFKDVVGQEAITKILEAQIKSADIKHSYIFAGPSGDGKTTTARIFAKELNGGNKSNIIEIDGASNNGVDNIRELRDSCQFKPIGAKYKIYIIDECHMLSIGAFNGLLKTLEEPPEHCIFILCTTDPQKIPATIISRCQRFDFRRLSTELIAGRLEYIVEQENRARILANGGSRDALEDPKWAELEGINLLEIDKPVYRYIAGLANGGMRRAITMLETCINYPGELNMETVSDILGVSSEDTIYELYKAVSFSKGQPTILDIIESQSSRGKDLKLMFKQLIEMGVRICKLYITGKSELSDFTSEQAKKIGYDFVEWGLGMHLEVLDALLEVQQRIKYETDIKSLLEGELMTLWLGKRI